MLLRENHIRIILLLSLVFVSFGDLNGNSTEKNNWVLRIEPYHAWLPPFGIDRVGLPISILAESISPPDTADEFWVFGYRQGKEIERRALKLPEKPPYTASVKLDTFPDEIVLRAKLKSQEEWTECARLAVPLPNIEADVQAQPETIINPVDLGTVLFPADWLLLTPGQKTILDIAAVSHSPDVKEGLIQVWFASTAHAMVTASMPLVLDRRNQLKLQLPAKTEGSEQDILHIVILSKEQKELWHKQVQTMFVAQPPQLPQFGATEMKLRYPLPISVRHPETGVLSSIPYENAWDLQLNDVVVSLPNGSRFVFWRGSSYVPFWAGRYNTGLCYEWAETGPLPDGFTDSVEPLMDKELRYGRVQIIESTESRVHVRWRYQSCDFLYKVWGDEAQEDFYFYPDGFGTRTLSLKSAPNADYELSEFIILSPPAAYPFRVLPENLIDVLFMDGAKRKYTFPFVEGENSEFRKSRGMPAVYRVHLNREEKPTAVYFTPNEKNIPPGIFGPFSDQGQLVTPAYWGSHWPLARGKTTGYAIDDRIYVSPAHNSIMTWARCRPTPIRTATYETLDSLGRSKTILMQQWVWLIGMSDASDESLLQWARSFSSPAALEVSGAKLDFDAYIPERRAYRMAVESPIVKITIKPNGICIHPVFELIGVHGKLTKVMLSDRSLCGDDYTWDGKTFWLNADIHGEQTLQIEFRN